MISQYDEYPVHQTSSNFDQIPSTDLIWSEGYWIAVYNADEHVCMFFGMRVYPNSDLICGYAGISDAGRQVTARFRRPWRELTDTRIGPYSISFPEPLEVMHLALEENDSPLTFDLDLISAGSIMQEPLLLGELRGRRTVEMARYRHIGTVEGTVQLGDKEWTAKSGEWWSNRAHSWGLCPQFTGPQLVPDAQWLPPDDNPEPPTGLWLSVWWGSPENTGLFSVHETPQGARVDSSRFGPGLKGGVNVAGSETPSMWVDARHELEFHPGTKVLSRGTWYLTDGDGNEWKQVFEPGPGAWNTMLTGYGMGSWTDGGNMFTFRHADGYQQDWDDYDFTPLVYDYTRHDGTVLKDQNNPQYLGIITTTAPDGSTSRGHAAVEMFAFKYEPYGLG